MARVSELQERLEDLETRRAELLDRIQHVKTGLASLAYPIRSGNGEAKAEHDAFMAELPQLEAALLDLDGDINQAKALLQDAIAKARADDLAEAQESLRRIHVQAIEAWFTLADKRAELRDCQAAFDSAVRRSNDSAALLRGMGIKSADGFVLPNASDAEIRRRLEHRLRDLQELQPA